MAMRFTVSCGTPISAFHTDLGLGIMALAGIASVLIAGLTVSYQSIRAATANPLVSLRSE